MIGKKIGISILLFLTLIISFWIYLKFFKKTETKVSEITKEEIAPYSSNIIKNISYRTTGR